ncbi:hypothetical protein ACFL41_00190 [Gemmatimonadota bacterium]
MSQVVTRPRVRVASTLLRAAVGSARLAGEALQTWLEEQSTTNQNHLQETSGSVQNVAAISEVETIPVLRERFHQAQLQHLTDQKISIHEASVDALKEATLEALNNSAYFVRGGSLDKELERLHEAHADGDVRSAVTSLLKHIEDEHHRVIQESLTSACTIASRKAGFNVVEVTHRLANRARVIAHDQNDRVLISEISFTNKEAPTVETEVLGISDGSCQKILEVFDEELEEAGVIVSEPPLRRFTSGVAESQVALEFLCERASKKPVKKSRSSVSESSPSESDVRRRHRLNQQTQQRHR